MKRFYKVLSLLLALVLCCACVAPAFAEGEPDPATCEHVWRNNVIIRPATCVPGIQGDRCTLCNATRNEMEIPAVQEHDLIMVIDTQPTCGAAGVGHQYCTVCGNVFNEGSPVEPTGEHDYKWVTDVEPLCGKAGYKHEECTVCHAVRNEYSPIPLTNLHTYVWVIDRQPTCGAQGTKHEECSVCRANEITTTRSEGTAVAATGAHTWQAADDARNRASTCIREGTQVYVCSVCGNEKADALPKAAHTDANGDDKCDVCGVYVGSGTGVTFKSVVERIGNFFWQLWERFRKLFTGEYFN